MDHRTTVSLPITLLSSRNPNMVSFLNVILLEALMFRSVGYGRHAIVVCHTFTRNRSQQVAVSRVVATPLSGGYPTRIILYTMTSNGPLQRYSDATFLRQSVSSYCVTTTLTLTWRTYASLAGLCAASSSRTRAGGHSAPAPPRTGRSTSAGRCSVSTPACGTRTALSSYYITFYITHSLATLSTNQSDVR